jgi:hypothetical protein
MEAQATGPRSDAAAGWLTPLQAAVAVLAGVLCFRGRGQQHAWVGLALLLPALRFLLAPAYRRKVLVRLRRLWASVEAYHRQRDRLPWGAAFVLVVVPAAVLFLSNHRTQGSGDTWPVVPTACRLVTRGTWELTPYLDLVPPSYRADPQSPLPYCVVQTPTGVYSGYPAGMVQFALPVAAVARCVGADLDNPRVLGRLEKWTAAWVAALALGLFFLLALHLTEPVPAALTTLFLAGGSAVFSTVGQGLWQHGGIIFWSLVLLLVEFRQADRPVRGGAWLQGLACGMMLACRLSAGLFALAFGLWVLVRSPRRAVVVGLAGALAYAPWALLYGSVYGTVLGPSAGQMAGSNWRWPAAGALAGVLASPGRGLLVYQPWALLGLLAFLPVERPPFAPREGSPPCPAGWDWFCGGLILLHLALVAGWQCWWGGHCWGSRLAAEVVPLCGLLCARPVAALWRSRTGWPALACVALLSFLMHAPAVFWDAGFWNNAGPSGPTPESLWSWSRPPFLYPLQQRAGAGQRPGALKPSAEDVRPGLSTPAF